MPPEKRIADRTAISGTRRVVVLPEIDPAAYGSKDLDDTF